MFLGFWCPFINEPVGKQTPIPIHLHGPRPLINFSCSLVYLLSLVCDFYGSPNNQPTH